MSRLIGRIHTSPTSPVGSTLPSPSSMRSSPFAERPTEPWWASHSTPLSVVEAWPSVPPYSSHTRSGPSQPIQHSFSHAGHGAARCHTRRSVLTSNAARSSSGSFQMRCIIVGTRYIAVPR